jgi:cellulose synthase/poly-beta-1,6-N-acetylglucosamine synthase-like glycosyltransferase
MNEALLAAFATSCFLLLYVYVAYPVAIRVLGALRPSARRVVDEDRLPRVALVISAHNEAAVIDRKLANAEELDYPDDLLLVVVSSDGSTDGTNELVTAAAARWPNLRLVAHARNRGKTAALLDTLGQIDLDVEVVVFSDANAMYEPNALRALVRHFADPRVGAVAGEVTYTDAGSERFYRRYENWIKRWESAQGSCLAAEGSIFAARRSLIPVVDPTHVEDLAIPLGIALSGYDVVYEPEARSTEEYRLPLGAQFRRRRRIVNRAIRTVAAYPDILKPWRSGTRSMMFFSHRVLRWATPVALLLALLSSAGLLLVELTLQELAATIAIGVAGTVLLALVARRFLAALVRIAAGILVANAAVLAGLASVARGEQVVTWNPDR